jgi:hypothetical protein
MKTHLEISNQLGRKLEASALESALRQYFNNLDATLMTIIARQGIQNAI